MMNAEIKFLTLAAMAAALSACGSKEDKAPAENLKPLAPISAPKADAGTYMGALPGGDCDKLQIKMVLDSTAHALVTETCIQDSITSVTRKATYRDSADVLIVTFEDAVRKFEFKKQDGFSAILLDEAGKTMEDESGEPYRVMRILNMPGSK